MHYDQDIYTFVNILYSLIRPQFDEVVSHIEEIEMKESNLYTNHPLSKFKDEIEHYCTRIPVLGFNSGK